jgi:hypothetical protein
VAKSTHDFSYVYGLRGGPAVGSVSVALDDQERMVVQIVLDGREERVDDNPGYVAEAVDVIASWLDYHKFLGFRQFDLKFAAYREMLLCQKQKDRNRAGRFVRYVSAVPPQNEGDW